MNEAGPSSAGGSPSQSQLGYIVLPGTPFTPNALQLNDDGQFSILTRSEISIFTPKLGLQAVKGVFKQLHGAKEVDSGDEGGKGKQRDRTELDCSRTIIVIERKNIIKWDTFSNVFGWGTPAPPFRVGESYWRSLSWSPTGLSQLGGCVLATLTTNHEVIIYEPSKQPYTGEWAEVYDVSSHLVRLLVSDKTQKEPNEHSELPLETDEVRKERATRLLECQAVSLAWSPPVDGSLGDFSLLVLGHKSGHVSLWRRWAGGKMEILHRFRLDSRARSITSLEWSRWSLSHAAGRKLATACLAVADANGAVWSLEITQDVSSPRIALQQSIHPTEVDTDASGIFAASPVIVAQPDRRAASQLKWIINKSQRLLVYTKLGVVTVVELHRPPAPSPSVYAVKQATEIELPAASTREWMGATAYEPCAGISYLSKQDALVVALTSACFYTIALQPTPALVGTSSDSLPTSTKVTALMRETFISSLEYRPHISLSSRREVPVGKITAQTGSRVTGLSVFGLGGRELGWLHEISRPDQLTYRTNPNIKTTFLISSIGQEADPEWYLAHLREVLEEPPNSRLRSPLGLLRSFLHFALDKAHMPDFVEALLDLLERELPEPAQMCRDAVEPDPKAVATAFYVRLFGEYNLETLRLRETIARFVLRHPRLPRSLANRAVRVHTSLSRQVSKQVVTRMGVILNTAQLLLSAEELQVSGRTLLASASVDLPAQDGEDGSLDSLDPDALRMAFTSGEACPACKGEIAFSNLRRATCIKGHVWDRCSITLAVIATPKTRTCTACERKALLELPKPPKPPANAEGEQAAGMDGAEEECGVVVDGMLRAATCCLYCGGRWMRFL